MSAAITAHRPVVASDILFGFAAGFLATLLFHQPVLALLAEIGLTKASPYSLAATVPLGVPQVISLAFWGGVWGIVFVFAHRHFPGGAKYWIYAFVFGAVLPTLVAWFVAAPLKGLPMAAGWRMSGMLTGVLVNGAWGVGTALLLALARRLSPRRL